ncbi:hypothetical protein D9756_002773 [Leucocoprinus leucothites]|uniref:Uncharacterized protein n=1 Tax=Leucocoprinus leucothites TaxID=201217 RepID=A0A8H5GCF9_9AGAR|nr:hypothetical protein D9756_002773 [Leucoagaricus leucothites]
MSAETVPPEKSMTELRQNRERSHLLDVHRNAMFVLTQKDRPIPSLQEMKDDLEKDELTSIKERIANAKVNHRANLERIYAAHAEDYLDDQRLRRESRGEYIQGQFDGESMSSKLAEWSEKRDPLASIDHHYEASLKRSVAAECARYASVIVDLSAKKYEIEQRLEEERRQRDAAFPLTLEEFHSKPRDIQIRVANFLSSDGIKREKMMSEFGWAWRQVTPLIREFETNEEFQNEVSILLETLESRDPRRRGQ